MATNSLFKRGCILYLVKCLKKHLKLIGIAIRAEARAGIGAEIRAKIKGETI